MKRLRVPFIPCAVVVTVAAIVIVGGVANAEPKYSNAAYQISGSGPVAEYVSYQTETGQYNEANVKLPWSKQFTPFQNQVFVISAQGPGPLTCTILADGKVISKATANGQPARTVCSH